MQFHVGMRSSFFPRCATPRRAASRATRHDATHCLLLRETVLSGKAMPTYANDALYARVAALENARENAVKVTQHRAKLIAGFLLRYLNISRSPRGKKLRKIFIRIVFNLIASAIRRILRFRSVSLSFSFTLSLYVLFSFYYPCSEVPLYQTRFATTTPSCENVLYN